MMFDIDLDKPNTYMMVNFRLIYSPINIPKHSRRFAVYKKIPAAPGFLFLYPVTQPVRGNGLPPQRNVPERIYPAHGLPG